MNKILPVCFLLLLITACGGETPEPGRHTLQMLLGDHLHIPHDPPLVSDRITILVE